MNIFKGKDIFKPLIQKQIFLLSLRTKHRRKLEMDIVQKSK